ncbi:MAG TPA: hypothetical protein VNO20_00280 [Solirubrobacterales bacterium]|nr:hypothetical protein [Solirubrobacterales bacterium]
MSPGKDAPPGWTQVSFGEVAENVTITVPDPEAAGIERFVGLDHLDPRSLEVGRWGAVADGTTFRRFFSAGQVLFGKRRAYQRKAAVPAFDGVCSGDILVFEAKDGLDPRLLPFVVHSDAFVDHALATSAGSLSPRTKWSELRKFEMLLPPKKEQARLVDLFEAVNATACADENVARNAQLAVEITVADFLRGGTWPTAQCEELLSSRPQNGLSPPVNDEERGYPTLSIGAVKQGRVVSDGHLKWSDVERAAVEPYLLRRSDVLVVRGNGSRDLTGRCGLVEEVPDQCFYPDLLIRLVFDEADLRPAFAALQWNSRVVQGELMRCAKSTNGIWKINGKDVKRQVLRIPPLPEQDCLLERIAALDALLRAATQRAGTAKSLTLALIADRLELT